MPAAARKGSGPLLEVKLHAFASFLAWVQEVELRFSGKLAHALNPCSKKNKTTRVQCES